MNVGSVGLKIGLVAESQRDLDIKRAMYLETVKKQQAQADKIYEIQTNVMQQQVVAEAVKIRQIEKEQEVKVQEAEIQRRERELIATVLKGAEIERRRIETLGEAERNRAIFEADGRAAVANPVLPAERRCCLDRHARSDRARQRWPAEYGCWRAGRAARRGALPGD